MISPKLIVGLLMCSTMAALARSLGVWVDEAGDATVRRTDSGNDAPLPTGFIPIDLLSTTIHGWQPNSPTTDLYTGFQVFDDADFVRIDIQFAGLVCPPGPIALDSSSYQPYMFGDRPVMGFLELDIDQQRDSGGELMPIAQHRYLANVGRFSKSPSNSSAERIAQSHLDIDTDFFSGPQFERSGAEFSLTLCGCFTPTIVAQNGDMDSLFDAGETWIVEGRFFERFVSFQPESALFGGSAFGLFDPLVQLRFSHSVSQDITTVTLVFPLTNEGAAMEAGQVEQPIDLSLLNQTSIEEAVDDLIIGAGFATGEVRILSQEWQGESSDELEAPEDWEVSALIGTAPTVQDPTSLYIWTDTGFDELVADFDLDEANTALDEQALVDFIADNDGTGIDSDQSINGLITLGDPGAEFHFFDLNNDGIVSMADSPIPSCPADYTHDGILNFFDVSIFLGFFQANDPQADLTGDGIYNFFDISAFLTQFAAGCP